MKHHCSQQGRAHATHGAVSEQLLDILLDAEYGYGRRVGRTLENTGAPEHPRTWRAGLLVLVLQVRSGQANQVRSGQVRSNQVRSDQSGQVQIKSGQIMWFRF